MNKKLLKICNIILISSISISSWEIVKKQYRYIQNSITYNQIQQEKKVVDNVQEYLYDKEYDWINVSDTAINYPLVISTDNEYYLDHNYKNEYDIGGSIFYDAIDKSYNGATTVIFGHSMRNGSMFNNLHFFQKDNDRFKESILTINTKEKRTEYKPIGYCVYNSNDPFYREIDDQNVYDAYNYLKTRCDYFIYENTPKDNSHIIALVTCDYSIDNGRLVVFYMSE